MSSRLVLPPSRFFPPAESADEFGLVCIGGELSPEWLLDAYRHGLFPWPLIERISEPQWWSPDPRAIIEFKQFHISPLFVADIAQLASSLSPAIAILPASFAAVPPRETDEVPPGFPTK